MHKIECEGSAHIASQNLKIVRPEPEIPDENPRNPKQEPAFSVQGVSEMQFLVWDFGV